MDVSVIPCTLIVPQVALLPCPTSSRLPKKPRPTFNVGHNMRQRVYKAGMDWNVFHIDKEGRSTLHSDLTEEQARIIAQTLDGRDPWKMRIRQTVILDRFGPVIDSRRDYFGSYHYRDTPKSDVKIWKNGTRETLDIWPKPDDYTQRYQDQVKWLDTNIEDGELKLDYWSEPGFLWLKQGSLYTKYDHLGEVPPKPIWLRLDEEVVKPKSLWQRLIDRVFSSN